MRLGNGDPAPKIRCKSPKINVYGFNGYYFLFLWFLNNLEMKKFYSLLLFALLSASLLSQVSPDKYWVRFTDKDNSPFSISNPGEFLSQRAIDRRIHFGIPVVENDLPVNPQYIEGVENTGVTVLTVSKWMNSVTIYTTDPVALDAVSQLPYVLSVTKGNGSDNNTSSVKPFFANETYLQLPETGYEKSLSSYNYGGAYNQIHMLNGDVMHDMGYNGTGMVIAVLDAGFRNANTIDAFDSLWDSGRILGVRDFVSPLNPDIFASHSHGTMVLSTMGANWSGNMVGTAPGAAYWLIRTEDGDSEYLIEELNWVSGAELADSAGADIINSSLGYTEFDDPSQNHTYADMDGNTTPVTIGADMVASKGMIAVNSAGNSGGSAWQYIGAPADGDSVFSIGAVDDQGNYAGFSSTGPTFDGRVKPNVVAQGQGSAVIDPWTGEVAYGSGTSFSSPITAGMVACLWQANPDKRNTEIMTAIQMSATQANNPDDYLGYGIPDYVVANSLLTVIDKTQKPSGNVEVFPNPFNREINVKFNPLVSPQQVSYKITDLSGKMLKSGDVASNGNSIRIDSFEHLAKGCYFLYLNNGLFTETIKIVKEK